jgi:hypothetical protein
VISSKTIQEARANQGKEVGTTVTRQGGITITTHATRDDSLHRTYYTRSIPIYDKSDSIDDRGFLEGRQAGRIVLHREDGRTRVECGQLLGLREMLASGQ